MSTAEIRAKYPPEWMLPDDFIPPPDHLGLPESDGRIVENSLEHPQGAVLSDSLWPVLGARHPDGQFFLGRDTGIYYKWEPDDPLAGSIAPDWFYVPGVPPMLGGTYRRSYVLWKEVIKPLIVLEFASGNGSDERDRTPPKGKFYVYENAILPAYYGIHGVQDGVLEMYEHRRGELCRMEPNARGRFLIPELGVELGTWAGRVENFDSMWLRWFLPDGRLLLSGAERADHLAAQLRALGIEPEA